MSADIPPSQRVRELPVDLVQPGKTQARRKFDPQALAELAASISESGVVQPIVVRTIPGGRYEILAGERRWRATQAAGLHNIPALIRDDLSDAEAMVLGLIENLQREALPPIDAAHGMKKLGETFTLTHEQIGERIGKTREYVTNYIRLLSLHAVVAELVNGGALSAGHGKALAALSAGQEQITLAQECIRDNLSVRALERRIAALKGQNKPASKKTGSDSLRLEQELSDHMGYPVKIDAETNSRGSLRITYSTLEELDGILERIGFRAS